MNYELYMAEAIAEARRGAEEGEAPVFTTHEPCAMCVGALIVARVRALVFAVSDAERGAAGGVTNLARNPAMPHQLSVVSGVREAEARRLVAESASV